jgi:hypothetical protein
MAKQFYIKERNNPQFKKPYYVAEGQLTKKDAKKKENSLYGDNYMTGYATEQEYKDAIEKLKADGYSVQ